MRIVENSSTSLPFAIRVKIRIKDDRVGSELRLAKATVNRSSPYQTVTGEQ